MAHEVAHWLKWATGLGLARLDAQLLLAHHLGKPRTWVMAHDDAQVADAAAAAFEADCQRRADDWPLAYLVGQREFHGLMLQVTPAVLVPRPDTETLVTWAIECAQSVPPGNIKILDLGTGSGAVALALAVALSARSARVTATDISAEALGVARANAGQLSLPVELRQGAWWQAVDGGRFDLVVSNPPYIAAGDAHLLALRHEPLIALASGIDGLTALREIVAGAPQHLMPGAWLLLEHGADQAPAVRALLAQAGFEAIASRRDIEQRERCTGGRWAGV